MVVKTNPLSIETLGEDLVHAEGELAKAAGKRLHAQEVEQQWQMEVTSLKNLIEVRKRRLHPTKPETRSLNNMVVPSEQGASLSKKEEISHVEWILRTVGSSQSGISPPELLREATKAGVKMHKNYPYVVLGKLVEKGKVRKADGRYYAAEDW
ncbi:MAG TPA: hypothetical protein VGN17_24370 [Bryobacteraceae bacterium]|jgi:hypothetical protein